jgi:hypothetical protein
MARLPDREAYPATFSNCIALLERAQMTRGSAAVTAFMPTHAAIVGNPTTSSRYDGKWSGRPINGHSLLDAVRLSGWGRAQTRHAPVGALRLMLRNLRDE